MAELTRRRLLSTAAGAALTSAILPPNLRMAMPFHLDTRKSSAQAIPSTSHAWSVQHDAWNGGRMDNWLPAHRRAAAPTARTCRAAGRRWTTAGPRTPGRPIPSGSPRPA